VANYRSYRIEAALRVEDARVMGLFREVGYKQ
jgi:hypothetical protein